MKDVEYYGGIPSIDFEGVQYCGGLQSSTVKDVEYCGGIPSLLWRLSSAMLRDAMNTVEDIQYSGR